MMPLAAWLLGCGAASGPSVTILFPSHGANLPAGEVVEVLAYLDRSRCEGSSAGPVSSACVRHYALCLWVDGTLFGCVDEPTLARPLAGITAGAHVLTVRAVELNNGLAPGQWCEPNVETNTNPANAGVVPCVLGHLSNGAEVYFTSGEPDADGDGAVVDEDCDDADAAINPSAPELCNGVDDDCDGTVDDGVIPPIWFADTDRDGLGDPETGIHECFAPEGTAPNGDDCDDNDENVGLPTTWYTDADADGCGDPFTGTVACEAPPGTVADNSDPDDANPDDCTPVPP